MYGRVEDESIESIMTKAKSFEEGNQGFKTTNFYITYFDEDCAGILLTVVINILLTFYFNNLSG